MRIHIQRYGAGATLDFNQEETISARPLTEYIQYLGIGSAGLSALAGKKILLIGGGVSRVREWLEKIGIKAEVTNLDFFFKADRKVAHKHINEDFYEWAAPRDAYDEIWSLYALPLYSLSKPEVELFFAKAAIALAPGGVLRAFPINEGDPTAIVEASGHYGHKEKTRDSLAAIEEMERAGMGVEIVSGEGFVPIRSLITAGVGADAAYAKLGRMLEKWPWKFFDNPHEVRYFQHRGAMAFKLAAPHRGKEEVNLRLADYIARSARG